MRSKDLGRDAGLVTFAAYPPTAVPLPRLPLAFRLDAPARPDSSARPGGGDRLRWFGRWWLHDLERARRRTGRRRSHDHEEQYIATADVACSDFNGEVRKLPEPKDATEIGPLYRKIAGKADTFYDKFSAIPKPRRNQQILDRYQHNLAQSIALTKQAASVIEKREPKALPRVLKSVRRVQRENRRIAKRFGFQVCGGVVR